MPLKISIRYLGLLIVLLHSMIGYWRNPVVCPSVCPSVCDAVHSGFHMQLVYRANSCTSVFLAGTFLFAPSDTFAVGCII